MPHDPGEPSGLLGDRALTSLRAWAGVLGVTPRISVRVRSGERVVVEAMRPPFPERSHLVVAACEFRGAVARAHRFRRAGEHVAMHGLTDGVEPTVEVDTEHGVEVVAGGVVRVTGTGCATHLLAVCQPVEAVHPVVAEVIGERRRGHAEQATASTAPRPPGRVHLHADRELDVTVVAAVLAATDPGLAAGVELVRTVGIRCAVAELESQLNGTVDDVPPGPRRDQDG